MGLREELTSAARRKIDGVTKLSKYPLELLLRKRRSLRRELLCNQSLAPIRVAVLGGSTTQELIELLEIFLLDAGFSPSFYEAPYGQFYETAVHDLEELIEFAPSIVYIHTCTLSLQQLPPLSCTEELLAEYVNAELSRYRHIWKSLGSNLNCQVIQNNFELPAIPAAGHLDSVIPAGVTRFIGELNRAFATEAAANPRLVLQDLNGIAARLGIANWFDPGRWFSFKLANSVEGTVAIARSLTSLVNAIYGRTRKVLALDLDNTLWGGVIGDVGVEGIVIGRETPIGQAYNVFQHYCLRLRNRGILLAVCSKNDESTARDGFSHPDMVLKLEDFAAFRANWNPKHESLISIANELSLGLDSFVFVDDNPAERAIVEAQLPEVAVPDVGADIARFPFVIEAERYFEPLTVTREDLTRSHAYRQNSARVASQQRFADYGEYLDSLQMVAEIGTATPLYFDRIAQLTNKTNQFNLTTRRYSLAEIESVAGNSSYLCLYGKLIDRFGEHGLISVVLGRVDEAILHIELWLMSCRVLKREMELAMLDALVEHARDRGVQQVIGYFRPTAKNALVADMYNSFGFAHVSQTAEGGSIWSLDITDYRARTRHITLNFHARDDPGA